MDQAFFLTFGFAVLLALNHGKKLSGSAFLILKEGGDFFWHTALLLVLFYAFRQAPPLQKEGLASFFFLPGAYFLSRFQKKPHVFFLAVFSAALFIESGNAPSLLIDLRQAAWLAFLLTLMYFLLIGLKERLLLSSAPPMFAGFPIFMMAAALLLLICFKLAAFIFLGLGT